MISAAAGLTAAGETARHITSSTDAKPLPRIRCCAVVYGSKTTSSWSRPHGLWPLTPSTPTTAIAEAPDAHVLPHGLAVVPEEPLTHRAPNQHDRLRLVDVALRKRRALGDPPRPSVQKRDRYSASLRRPVAGRRDDRRRGVRHHRDALDARHLGEDRLGVLRREGGGKMARDVHPGNLGRARRNVHDALEGRELRLGPTLTRLSDRHHPHHRCNADRDAQRVQRGAYHLVLRERPQRLLHQDAGTGHVRARRQSNDGRSPARASSTSEPAGHRCMPRRAGCSPRESSVSADSSAPWCLYHRDVPGSCSARPRRPR